MKTILIVEDDTSLQDILRIIFAPEEYTVITYTSATYIEKRQYEVPDLFILDWRLPGGVDGIQLCRKLKMDQETCHIPVLMISASPNIVRAAKEAGADGALDKPFRIKVLREYVRKYTELPS